MSSAQNRETSVRQQRELAMWLEANTDKAETPQFKQAAGAFEELARSLAGSPVPEQKVEPMSSAPDFNPLGMTDDSYRNMNSALQTTDDMMSGAFQGLKNSVQFGEDIGRRAIDSVFGTDTLSTLNNRRADQYSANWQASQRSPTAYSVGETAAETLATAPIGFGAGIAGKAVVTHAAGNLLKRGAPLAADATEAAAKRAAMVASDRSARVTTLGAGGFLAGEGAGIGGYSTYGGLEDRLVEAGKGAVTDLVGGGLIDKAAGVGSAYYRRNSTSPSTDTNWETNQGMSTEGNPADYNKETIDSLVGEVRTNQDSRIAEAKEFGGYDMDTFIARGDATSLQRLQDIMSDPKLKTVYLNARAEAEIQKKEFAESKVAEFGTVTPDKVAAPEEGLKEFVDVLHANRAGGVKQYKEKWQAYRAAAEESNLRLDMGPVESRLQALMGDLAPDTTDATTDTYAAQLLRQLRKKQLVGGNTETVTTASTTPKRDAILPGLSTAGTKTIPSTRGEALSVNNYHDLISDVNGAANFKDLTPNEVRLRNNVLKALDEGLDEAMKKSGASDEVIALGKAARHEQASFHDKWSRNDIIDRLTSSKKGDPGTFRLDYSKALDNLTETDIDRLHAGVGLEAGNPVWQTLQQVKLLKALKAGMKSDSESTTALAASVGQDIAADGSNFSVQAFNYKGFFKEINSLDRTKRVKLWGEDAVKNFERMEVQMERAVKRPSLSGNMNVSGTAQALLTSGKFGFRGDLRDIAMGLSQAAPALFQGAKRGGRANAIADALSGNMDELSRKELEDLIASNLEKNYLSYSEFSAGDAVRAFMRMATVNATNSEGGESPDQ